MIQQTSKSRSITKHISQLPGCDHVRHGAVLIEMALILPVLILSMVIAIDLSRFLIVSSALNNAISQGINVGSATRVNDSTISNWNSAIQNAIMDTLHQYSWFNSSSLTIDIPTPSVSNGLVNTQGFRALKIHLTYQSSFIMKFPGLTQTYRISSVMQSDQIR